MVVGKEKTFIYFRWCLFRFQIERTSGAFFIPDGNFQAPVDAGVLLTASFQCPRDLYTASVVLDYAGGTVIQCATGSGYQQGVGSLIRQPSTLQVYNAGIVVVYVVAFMVAVVIGFATAGKPRGGVLD